MTSKEKGNEVSKDYREEYVKSPLSYYAVGILWLLWALLFPMYKLSHFIILGGISIAGFVLVRKLAPDVKVKVPVIEKPVDTGNNEVNQILESGRKYISQIRDANASINDEYVSQQVSRMEKSTDRIFKYIAKNPKEASQIRKFMNYYLPTLLKLLNAYIRLSSEGGSGKNVSESKEHIKNALSTIADAFDKQLDNLFMPEALDITTDIKVLEGILAQEGLKDDDMLRK